MSDAVPELLRPLVGERYDYFQGQLLSKGLKNNVGINFENELREPLAFLSTHFDRKVQAKVIEKLKNPPQIFDTIFELNCMKSVAQAFPVFYEPKLGNGKVAEFGFFVPQIGPLFFECKNPKAFRTEALSKFNTHNNLLASQLAGTNIVETAWGNGLRTEFAPKKRLNERDMKAVNVAAIASGPDVSTHAVWHPIPDLDIHFVPKRDGYAIASWLQRFRVTVGNEPVALVLENADVAFHSWPNLGRALDRTTANLLAEARRQLVIPKNGMGIIWLDVRPTPSLTAIFQEAVARPEYERILAVFVQGAAYFRSDRENMIKTITQVPLHKPKSLLYRTRYLFLKAANWLVF